ncbi:MAG: DUF3299 domain-containing protein [Cellvibrionaceae bacterium]|nr:DUF3299 domain-containing protein [Cellvibrionaceae bacterium]MCV6625451.1 DUF3299 domain-containing protein [Cellvibrionaceae bacterium]
MAHIYTAIAWGLALLGLVLGPSVGQAQALEKYKTISWEQLIPKQDLEALQNPPASISEIVDGSPEDQLDTALDPSDPYQQALVSTRVVDEFDGQAVRLPAFIVPLDFDDDHVVTEFFMVPYFGACLHMPPPPPNQIIYVRYDDGVKLEQMSQAFWFKGVLQTKLKDNDVAKSAYAMRIDSVEPYTGP